MEVQRIERGNLVLEGIPQEESGEFSRLLQYQNTRGAAFCDFDKDGGIFILTRFAETRQIHRVSQPGAYREQLTFFKDPVVGVSVCPQARSGSLLFCMDKGGSEFYQIYSYDLATAKAAMLTDGASRNTVPVWSRAGLFIYSICFRLNIFAGDVYAYSSNRRNKRDMDIWLGNQQDGVCDPHSSHKLLLEVEGSWHAMEFSPYITLIFPSLVNVTQRWPAVTCQTLYFHHGICFIHIWYKIFSCSATLFPHSVPSRYAHR